jgi:hypothetical protein
MAVMAVVETRAEGASVVEAVLTTMGAPVGGVLLHLDVGAGLVAGGWR